MDKNPKPGSDELGSGQENKSGVQGVLLTGQTMTELNYLIGEIPLKYAMPLVDLLRQMPMKTWVAVDELTPSS